jgi:hypothetical protein
MIAEIFLGFKSKTPKYEVKISNVDPTESYISTVFYDGNFCELTTKSREVEIRLFCPSNSFKEKNLGPNSAFKNFVGEISEPSSCKYLMNFYSDNLCDYEGFKEPKVNKF